MYSTCTQPTSISGVAIRDVTHMGQVVLKMTQLHQQQQQVRYEHEMAEYKLAVAVCLNLNMFMIITSCKLGFVLGALFKG